MEKIRRRKLNQDNGRGGQYSRLRARFCFSPERSGGKKIAKNIISEVMLMLRREQDLNLRLRRDVIALISGGNWF